jgi:hypothetical protein
MLDETTKAEVIRKAGSAGLLRMNHVEAERLLDWLLANGFTYTGPGLTPEPQRKKADAFTTDGQPIWKR